MRNVRSDKRSAVQRQKERERYLEQPLPAPFQHRDGNWWSGVIDDYIAATKRDKIDRADD